MHQICAIDLSSLLGVAYSYQREGHPAVRARDGLSPQFERSFKVYTLIIEGTLKADKKQEFNTAWRNEILPTLKKQNGFVDEMLLFETENPNRGVGLSFWKRGEDAERYQRDVFPQLVNSLRHLIETAPTVRSFTVEAAETFRIAAGKAA
jgi:heme-degrading monooxygenase HmoA